MASIYLRDLWPFAIGERVLHGDADTRKDLTVVDINPADVCTPYPCVMLAWRAGGKVYEGVVETKYLRRA